jgi:hypothetical protein
MCSLANTTDMILYMVVGLELSIDLSEYNLYKSGGKQENVDFVDKNKHKWKYLDVYKVFQIMKSTEPYLIPDLRQIIIEYIY